MNAQDVLAESVLACKPLLGRFLADFDEQSRVRTAPGLPNHLAWTLGHLALYLHRTAEQLDGAPLPPTDFATDGSGGSAERYDAEAIAFGSEPGKDAERYPTLPRVVAICDAACDRLAAAIRTADDATLERTVSWAGMDLPLWGLIQRITFHCGFHTGQIADLRRALGLGRVIQ